MMRIKTILMVFGFFALWSASISWAGGHVIGNGGYVLKCESAGKTIIKSFDLVEGDILYKQFPKYSSQKDFREKAKEIISRIKKLNPSRVELYLKWLKSFEKELLFLPSGVALADIPDVSIGILPQGCQLKQAIVQNNQSISGQPRYLINSDLWNAMSEDTKAALVIHEIIYRDAIQAENRHINSYYVRQFNQWLHSGKISSMSLKEYISFLRERFFAQADAHDISIMLFSFRFKSEEIQEFPVEFWDENSVKSATLYWRGRFQRKGIQAHYECWPHLHQMINSRPQVLFYANRQVKRIEFPSVGDSQWSQELACSAGTIDLGAFGFNGKMKADIFEFSEAGELQKAIASGELYGEILNFHHLDKKWNVSMVNRDLYFALSLFPFEKLTFTKEVCSKYGKVYLMRENGQPSANILKEIKPGNSAEAPQMDFCL